MKKKKKIGDDVHIGQLVTPFQSVGKSAAIDNTASDFDDANLNVKKKNRRLIERGINDADIAHYISGTLELGFQGMIKNMKTTTQTCKVFTYVFR